MNLYESPWFFVWTIILFVDLIAIVSVLVGKKPAGEKLLWSVLILLLPLVGLLLYLLLGRDRRDRQMPA